MYVELIAIYHGLLATQNLSPRLVLVRTNSLEAVHLIEKGCPSTYALDAICHDPLVAWNFSALLVLVETDSLEVVQLLKKGALPPTL